MYDNKYLGINVYLYEYNSSTEKINTSYKTFNSINELSNYLGVAYFFAKHGNFKYIFKYICTF